MDLKRRNLLTGFGGLSVGLILSGCGSTNTQTQPSQKQNEEAKEGEVTATEDLMREHGVLRRALFVYSEAAAKLRTNPSSVPPDALQKTAKLFRAFGEEYHEKKLEETFIFPAVKNVRGVAASYPDILVAQHQRGREITDYILAITQGAKLDTSKADSLAKVMDSLVRMYQAHAAIEDTIIFPAWKETLTAKQLDEMNDKFEDIEHEQFGEDGFDDAVKQIGEIEKSLGLADLSQFTAPPLPKK